MDIRPLGERMDIKSTPTGAQGLWCGLLVLGIADARGCCCLVAESFQQVVVGINPSVA